MDKNGIAYKKKHDLLAVYNRLRTTQGLNEKYLTRDVIIDSIMKQPAPRFYLEPRTIEHIVMSYITGVPNSNSNRNRERDKDLCEAYYRIKNNHPELSGSEIWIRVGEQPAKSFYMSKRSIRDFIFGYRK